MNKSNLSSCVGVVMLLSLNSAAVAYESIEVTNGGTISGKISFKGSPPTNQALEVTKDTETCGSGLKGDYYLVAADGGLKNVVVTIENIDKGKPYDKKNVVAFNNKKCMFDPHVTTAVKDQKLGINNSDPVLHNTHLYYGKNLRTMYNIALPLQNKVIKKKLRKVGIVTVKCDAHEWMLGYIYVADHPYSTVSAADGTFSLKDVPPGNYKVKIWHEKLGEITKDVSVTASGIASLNHSFGK